MMITLMLAVALIMLGLLAVLPDIKQQIQRDREEELRHRGTAYMRAIKSFYKKFGRYPTRLEELENTNNIHFLRKRYKDPMSRDKVTGKEKDFKLLHQQDIALNNGPVLPGLNGPGGPGGPPAPGGLSGLQPKGGPAGQTSAGSDSGDSSAGNSETSANSNSSGSPSSKSDTSSNSGSGFNGPTFGGGPIVGVASTSKAKTIRVFFDKSHYNDWLFIYLQQADRGGLLTGPVNPNMPAGSPNGLLPGLPGQPAPGGGPAPGVIPNPGQAPVVPPPPPDSGQTPPQQ